VTAANNPMRRTTVSRATEIERDAFKWLSSKTYTPVHWRSLAAVHGSDAVK